MSQEQSAFESVKGKVNEDECAKAVENLQHVLHQFTCRPWFGRTWIRQEVFAARNIVFHFEEFEMTFDFQHPSFWQWLLCHPAKFRMTKVDPLARVSTQLGIMAKHFRHHGTDEKDYAPPPTKINYGLHWLRTLQEGTAFQVTDPRDRVYALLGIIASPSTRFWVASQKQGVGVTNGTAPKDFPVDYGKSVSTVYQDVVKYLINVERDLNCLYVFQDRRRRAPEMPSWVLDWRDPSPRIFIESSQTSSQLNEAIGEPSLQDMNGSSELQIFGFTASAIFSLHGDRDLRVSYSPS